MPGRFSWSERDSKLTAAHNDLRNLRRKLPPDMCTVGGVVVLAIVGPRPINGARLPTPATLLEQDGKVVPIEANAAP